MFSNIRRMLCLVKYDVLLLKWGYLSCLSRGTHGPQSASGEQTAVTPTHRSTRAATEAGNVPAAAAVTSMRPARAPSART